MIEEEVKSPRPDGYNQLLDEKNSTQGDEENQLLGIEDDTLFRDLSQDDPLYVERKNLLKAKNDLENYLKKRADKKQKITPQEEAMKSSLQ